VREMGRVNRVAVSLNRRRRQRYDTVMQLQDRCVRMTSKYAVHQQVAQLSQRDRATP